MSGINVEQSLQILKTQYEFVEAKKDLSNFLKNTDNNSYAVWQQRLAHLQGLNDALKKFPKLAFLKTEIENNLNVFKQSCHLTAQFHKGTYYLATDRHSGQLVSLANFDPSDKDANGNYRYYYYDEAWREFGKGDHDIVSEMKDITVVLNPSALAALNSLLSFFS